MLLMEGESRQLRSKVRLQSVNTKPMAAGQTVKWSDLLSSIDPSSPGQNEIWIRENGLGARWDVQNQPKFIFYDASIDHSSNSSTSPVLGRAPLISVILLLTKQPAYAYTFSYRLLLPPESVIMTFCQQMHHHIIKANLSY